jgi:two-component system response regulator FixJ
MSRNQTVYIVDDHDGSRCSMCALLMSIGLNTESFASAEDFLDAFDPVKAACLVLDIRLPGMSGIELQNKLTEEGVPLNVILISGHADAHLAAGSLNSGATAVLSKPFSSDELCNRVRAALAHA